MCATYFQYQVNLCDFLSAALCRLGEHQLPPQKELVIGGGFRDGEKAVTVTCDKRSVQRGPGTPIKS